MEITLNIPDEIARQVASEGQDPARVALEALALEGYRAERLSESAVREMLGFQTRMEVHAFLKRHGVYLHYDTADLEQDTATAETLRGRLQEKAPGKPRLG
jgi:predicted HTH domain antitoxin